MLPVSIIIPVYNVQDYLYETLNSIRAQTFLDWECILVDDGSSDDSGRICDEYSEKDSRFRVIHKENAGASSARNVGLSNATGKWICFVDSDDKLTEDALDYMFQKAEENYADVCVCAFVGETPVLKSATKVLTFDERRQLIWDCLSFHTDSYVREGLNVDGPCAKLFRGSIIRDNQLQFIDGMIRSEDALFDSCFYYHSKRIIMDYHPVYFYVNNPNSLCRRFNRNLPRILINVLCEEQRLIKECFQAESYYLEALYLRSLVGLSQILTETRSCKNNVKIQCVKQYLNSDIVQTYLSYLSKNSLRYYYPGYFQLVLLFFAKRKAICGLLLLDRYWPYLTKVRKLF